MLLEERFSRIRGGDLANEMPVSAVVGHRLGHIETGIYKELAGASSNDEAMVSIVRLGLLRDMRHLSGDGIEVVTPNEFVGISKGVLPESEMMPLGAALRLR